MGGQRASQQLLLMRKKRKIILGLALLAAAILTCLYPLISNYTATKYQSFVQSRYERKVQTMDNTQIDNMRQAALAYNRMLIPGAGGTLSFAEETLRQAETDYEQLLNVRGDGIMGYVEIPKINVELPIYHGTGDDSLDRGV